MYMYIQVTVGILFVGLYGKSFTDLLTTWMISFMRALSVDIFAFFITETEGPTQVTNTNFALLLISSPVYNKMIDAMI